MNAEHVYFKEKVATKIFENLPGIRVRVYYGQGRRYTSPNLQDTLDMLKKNGIVFTTTRIEKFKWEAKFEDICVIDRNETLALVKGIEKLYEDKKDDKKN